jgi:hypothetical protein
MLLLVLLLAIARTTPASADFLGALSIIVFAYPGDPFVSPPSRANVNAYCASVTPSQLPGVTCVANFAILGYTTDVLPAGGSYATPFVYGATVPPVLISTTAPVLDKHSNVIAANWSAMWEGPLQQSMSAIASGTNAYGLGIFSNGSLAPNCFNWAPNIHAAYNATSVDVAPGSLVLTTGALDFLCTGSNNPTMMCACVPAYPTTSPTRQPTSHSPTSRSPTDAPITPMPTTSAPTFAPVTHSPTPPTIIPTASPTRVNTMDVDLVIGVSISLGFAVVLLILAPTLACVAMRRARYRPLGPRHLA